MKPSTLWLTLVVALIWFCSLVLLAGVSTPGFSQASQAISELAVPGAPYSRLVRFGGFVPLGSIIVLFACVVARSHELLLPKFLVAALFWLTGVAITVAGIFPTDPGGQRNSLSGIVHAAAGLTLLIASSLTPFTVLFLLKDQPSPDLSFTVYTFLTGFALIGLFLLMPNAVLPGLVEVHREVLGESFSIWYRLHGMVQRTFMVIYFVWLGSFTHLYLREGRS